MEKSRLNGNMNFYDAMTAMCEGDEASTEVLKMLFNSGDFKYGNFIEIMLLDSFGIYGKNIAKFYEDACGGDINKLKLTLLTFLSGEFNERDIVANLNTEKVLPFVDDSVPFDAEIADFQKYVIFDEEKFKNFSKLQSEEFKQKLISQNLSGESQSENI